MRERARRGEEGEMRCARERTAAAASGSHSVGSSSACTAVNEVKRRRTASEGGRAKAGGAGQPPRLPPHGQVASQLPLASPSTAQPPPRRAAMAIAPIQGALRKHLLTNLSIGIGGGLVAGYSYWQLVHLPLVRKRDNWYLEQAKLKAESA
ncbi:hypothetical protein DMC30DRAFT_391502 [Rhodotorula diobovata]|uniref:Cytochrome c oxidase subunit 9, mitochondrial n=1 Tax=Rhodotorula diobovata TaxID=5288 RepID=A0A5C5G480_9BASI|nr:hypothetical protein DMC30DRAFT_391502 [Rhodotorula diobovata]